MSKKETILDLYFNKHLKQKEIANQVGTSQQYISKKQMKDIMKKKVPENLLMQKKEKLHKQNIKKIMLELRRMTLLMKNY